LIDRTEASLVKRSNGLRLNRE